MEHSFELASPWRTRALAAAAIAVLELVVLLGVALVILGSTVSDEVTKKAQEAALTPIAPDPPKPKRKPGPAAPKLTRGETSVLVLNGNGETGAAHAESSRLRELGYLIGAVGNAPRTDYTRSLVMYRPGYRPEARRLAKDRGVRLVTPLDGLRPSELMGAHVALVLGD